MSRCLRHASICPPEVLLPDGEPLPRGAWVPYLVDRRHGQKTAGSGGVRTMTYSSNSAWANCLYGSPPIWKRVLRTLGGGSCANHVGSSQKPGRTEE